MSSTPPDADLSACTIVYDGECALCQRQMRRVTAADVDGRFAQRARQDADLLSDLPQLAATEHVDGLRVVLNDGRVAIGADAVYEIARRLPRYRWLAPLYRFPPLRWLARRCYAMVARFRHRLGGRHPGRSGNHP